jgi:hypothetical protein
MLNLKIIMVVRVEVIVPKRIAGEYTFKNLEEFYHWVNSNYKRPKGLAGWALLSLAEKGSFIALTGMYAIKCFYDKPIGYAAKEIARKIGFLKTRGGSDTGINITKSIEFIKVVEKIE